VKQIHSNPKLVAKLNKYSGKMNWAVEFEHRGRPYSTSYTSIEEEAKAWGRIIRDHGWSIEGHCGPSP
jgi:hypothetical protein